MPLEPRRVSWELTGFPGPCSGHACSGCRDLTFRGLVPWLLSPSPNHSLHFLGDMASPFSGLNS